jgi:DNA-binding IclR family transcriptional regulator
MRANLSLARISAGRHAVASLHDLVKGCFFDQLCLLIKGTQLVTIDFQIGDRAGLHCTSIGKVLLAYQGAAGVEQVIRQGLPKLAHNAITDPARLSIELRKGARPGLCL